jgi:hypothetical protein
MTDRMPDAAEDHVWLLARERGEPGPLISEARARHYAQLKRTIADLPAVPAAVTSSPGWEQAVLAAIDAESEPAAEPRQAPPSAAVDDPRVQRATPTPRRRTAMIIAGAFTMAAGVAILLFVYRDRSDLPSQRPGVTRGMHVGLARLRVEHAFEVRRAETSAAHELRDGDTVMTGDRLRATLRVSDDAHLYVAFCDDGHLKMYTPQHGVLLRTGEGWAVPGGGRDLIVDAHVGAEVLYLIVSQDELAFADPQLAALVSPSAAGTVDCDAGLELALSRSTAVLPRTNVLRGERIATDAARPGSVVAADSDGIAVVRYRFIHVAPEPR